MTSSQSSIQFIKGVGPARKKLFENLGVETVEDLMYLFPRRYEDRRTLTPLAQVQVGEWQTVLGTVKSANARKSWHTKKHVMEVTLDDGGGRIFCVWFNQPYLINYFRKGVKVVCYGKVEVYKDRLQMISPEYEVINPDDDENLNLKRIVPIYPLTRGMSQRYMRKIMRACLDKYLNELQDELPVLLRNKHLLSNIHRSIQHIHFPDDFDQYEEALKRVSFEEFFFFQISLALRRLSITQKKGVAHKIDDSLAILFTDLFAFDLTKAQKRVIREIRADMQKTQPMLRLLQGDVGSGKTLTALFGCVAAFKNGYQSAIMAPTEILARQHYHNIQNLMNQPMLKGMKVGLLISSMKKEDRDRLANEMKNGDVDLVIGTHALISDQIKFKHLSYAVIDEQHKFGVRQRAILFEKGINPDVLIMTATPIPRTLCITLYGDLDVSVIDEMPANRGKIQTQLFSHDQATQVYADVCKDIDRGRQAYFVYPIIDESENVDLKSAEQMYKELSKGVFKKYKVGLIHGQIKQQNAEWVMNEFKDGKIQILIATTILEVGVDVTNASVMVIEHADRFGLAQLHQLRGRIGRGQHDSRCFLIADPTTQEGQMRMEAILKTDNGFDIAQKDLEIRGPGHFFGRHQHGLNELRVINPAKQMDMLELARKEVKAITTQDPLLNKKDHRPILKIIQRRYPTYLANVEAG